MRHVNVTHIDLGETPAPADRPIQITVTLECVAPLRHDLEWRVVYARSGQACEDEELEHCMTGPYDQRGRWQFTLNARPPARERILTEDVGVLILTGSYEDQVFLHAGYYVAYELTGMVLCNDTKRRPVVTRDISNRGKQIMQRHIQWERGGATTPVNK